MLLSRPKTEVDVLVHVDIDEAQRRLTRGAGVVESIVLSPTLGRTEEVVVALGPNTGGERAFAMRARHDYSNGLTRILRGTLRRGAGGTSISGQFETLLAVVLILRGIWVMMIFMSLALVARGLPWFVASLPLLCGIGLLVLIEEFGRRLGDRDEERVRRHLARAFADVR
ncbi:MAG: hypothetical protein U0271_13805 [Polyangiaceae bacterium]